MIDNKVGIFEEVREYPEPAAARRFASLVGLDDVKERLLKEARLLLDPESLAAWSSKSSSWIYFGTALLFSSSLATLEREKRYWQKLLATPLREKRTLV
jgi:hypothetical protein